MEDVEEHGSVAFVVDTTSSMGIAIPLVKQTILNLVRSSGSKIPKWILTAVNDPGANVQIETEDPVALETSVQALGFYGGGDAPEQNLLGRD